MSALDKFVLNPKTNRAVSKKNILKLQAQGIVPERLSTKLWEFNKTTGKPNRKQCVNVSTLHNKKGGNPHQDMPYLPPDIKKKISDEADPATRRMITMVDRESQANSGVKPLTGNINIKYIEQFITDNINPESYVKLFHNVKPSENVNTEGDKYISIHSTPNIIGQTLSRVVHISNHIFVKDDIGFRRDVSIQLGFKIFKKDEPVQLSVFNWTAKTLFKEIVQTARKVEIVNNPNPPFQNKWNAELENSSPV